MRPRARGHAGLGEARVERHAGARIEPRLLERASEREVRVAVHDHAVGQRVNESGNNDAVCSLGPRRNGGRSRGNGNLDFP